MSTGDIKNNLRKLQNELKNIDYTGDMDIVNMNLGIPSAFLPLLHYVISDFSCELSTYISQRGYDFYGKSDLRFIEILYKLLIQEFNMKPLLTKQQFFSIGYAEIKVIFVAKIINHFFQKNGQILSKLGIKEKPSKFSKLRKRNTFDVITKEKQKNVDILHKHDQSDIIEKNNLQILSTHESPVIPKPILELSLTPLKVIPSVNKEYQNDVLSNSIQDLTGKNNLDLSYEESIESSDSKSHPQEEKSFFKITKHALPVVSNTIVGFNLENFNIDSVAENNEELVEKETETIKIPICDACESNQIQLNEMENRVKRLEETLRNILTKNTDLSAKIVLLETKVDILENQKIHSTKDEVSSLTEINDETKNDLMDQMKPKRFPLKQIENFSGNSLLTSSHFQSYDSIRNEKSSSGSKVYSSLDYTDDETIIESFKPISMKDVQKFIDSETDIYSKGSISNQITNGKENSEDGSNYLLPSNFIGSNTQNTVYNVQQKLLETKRLLENV